MKVYKRSPRRMKVCRGRPVAGVGKQTISLYCAPLCEHTISLYCAPLQESVNTHTQVYRPRHYKSTMPRGAPPGNKNGATAHKVAICDNTRIATAASSPAFVNVTSKYAGHVSLLIRPVPFALPLHWIVKTMLPAVTN